MAEGSTSTGDIQISAVYLEIESIAWQKSGEAEVVHHNHHGSVISLLVNSEYGRNHLSAYGIIGGPHTEPIIEVSLPPQPNIVRSVLTGGWVYT